MGGGLRGPPVADWYIEGGVDRATLDVEHDNWREAVNFAVAVGDPVLALRLAGLHTRAAADPETGRWTASAMTVDGIDDLPDAHWLHYTMAIASASGNDYDSMARHIAAFEDASRDPRDRAWIAPFDAILAASDGRDPVAVLDEALSTPGLSSIERANLLLYAALMRNLPPATDTDAARRAVQATTGSSVLGVPVAVRVRSRCRCGRRTPMRRWRRCAVPRSLAEQTADTFIIASTSAWGSLATLGLPTDVAAAHLLGRLDRLQSYFGNSEATLLRLCLCVLRRVGELGGRARCTRTSSPRPPVRASRGPCRSRPARAGSDGRPPASLDAAVALARDGLAEIVADDA